MDSCKCASSLKEEPGGCDDEYGGSLRPAIRDENWFITHKNSIKKIDDLSGLIVFSGEEEKILKQVAAAYHMRIPRYYLSLIRERDNPLDPIRRQCIPSKEEMSEEINEDIDPLNEEKASPVPYLVHRYPDRALLLVTGQCFMYCRHCTRKRLWKNKIPDPLLRDINKALWYVKEHNSIREIIVSGGDPLTLPTERLEYILSAIARIKNIEVIRIGTRTPVVFPQRIDDSLCAVFKKYDNLWINLQFNHPWEVTPQAAIACRKLQKCGIPISNQSVLLKGVNDNPEVMTELCHKLQNIRVRPYYLFQCDPVVGTSHFHTPVLKGVEIVKRMQGYTSGMCIPKFVVDGIEGKGKVPLAPNYLVSASEEGVLLRNYKDELFFYPNPLTNKVGRRINAPQEKKTSKIVSTIGIVFNLKKNNLSFGDEQEEYDEITTIESLKEEIEKLGFEVKLFEQTDVLSEELRRQKPDFVLNLAEGIGAGRSRESQVPCILESLNIPYSGSDPVTLGITLDKCLTSKILKSANVPVPLMFMAEGKQSMEHLKDIFKLGKQFIVKPRWEGSSRGIFLNSVVDNFNDLQERVRFINSQYSQPAVVEEFMPKEEITAGVCGNAEPRLLGMMKIVPKEQTRESFLYSLEIKRDWQAKVEYEPQGAISLKIAELIEKYALTAYRVLELKDFARIDFRVGSDDMPRIIDINPLPGLSPRYSDLPILYRLKGKTYSELIKTLIEESFSRCGLSWRCQPAT